MSREGPGRTLPAWFAEAALGIFVHFTPASVPGFAPRGRIEQVFVHGQSASPYSEWYWNSLRIPGSPVARFHRERYGDRPYEAFAAEFRRGLEKWDAGTWASLFREAGARYVVLVAKHHDGFCLWPSEVPHPDPRYREWHAGRDVVGELARAVRAEGMRFGIYYSAGLDWSFERRPVRGLADLLGNVPGGAYPAYAAAQLRELIDRHRPSVLWNDIAWPGDAHSLLELVRHYRRLVPDGVINDRWHHRRWFQPALRVPLVTRAIDAALRPRLRRLRGVPAPPPPLVYDVRTTEYTTFRGIQPDRFECVRGMDGSFGYNRNSRPEDFLSREELLDSLAEVVSKNGNLLLNVGPRGEDAAIPEPQLERLRWLGEFTGRAGEAIYGTRPWRRAEALSREGVALRFTHRPAGDVGTLYVVARDMPEGGALTLADVPLGDPPRVRRLAEGPPPTVRRDPSGALRIELARGCRSEVQEVFAVEPVPA